MPVSYVAMSDEQRKSLALEYIRRLDAGEDVTELFSDNILMYFPKYGVVRGVEEARKMFSCVGQILSSISHDVAYMNVIIQNDLVVLEGTNSGSTTAGKTWRAGLTHAGRWCDVMEIRDLKIQRLFIYLDPDYGDEDVERYPWLRTSD